MESPTVRETLEENIFTVQSESRDVTHTVNFTMDLPSCECEDWARHHLPCKHMLSVIRSTGWDSLPRAYRDAPVFNLDEQVVGEYCNHPNTHVSPHVSVEHPTSTPQAPGSTPEESNQNIMTEQRKCREMAHEIVSRTYLCNDETILKNATTALGDILTMINQSLPLDGGLPSLPDRKRKVITGQYVTS